MKITPIPPSMDYHGGPTEETNQFKKTATKQHDEIGGENGGIPLHEVYHEEEHHHDVENDTRIADPEVDDPSDVSNYLSN